MGAREPPARDRRRERLRDEILPLEGLDADGNAITVRDDQGPRADTTYEKIAALAPVYRADGRITAATSSGQADGAAMCLLMEAETAARRGLAHSRASTRSPPARARRPI
jgi:acetyl-CoA acetyltransferase